MLGAMAEEEASQLVELSGDGAVRVSGHHRSAPCEHAKVEGMEQAAEVEAEGAPQMAVVQGAGVVAPMVPVGVEVELWAAREVGWAEVEQAVQ